VENTRLGNCFANSINYAKGKHLVPVQRLSDVSQRGSVGIDFSSSIGKSIIRYPRRSNS